jgi:hypothetical protein
MLLLKPSAIKMLSVFHGLWNYTDYSFHDFFLQLFEAVAEMTHSPL